MRGTVKFFDKNKGWGYITGMDGEDYFVHQTGIQTKGFRTLTAGDIVSCTPESTERGKKAADVILELPVLIREFGKQFESTKFEPEYKDFISRVDFINRTGIYVSPEFFETIHDVFVDSGVSVDEFVENYEENYSLYVFEIPLRGTFKYEYDDLGTCNQNDIIPDDVELNIWELVNYIVKNAYDSNMEFTNSLNLERKTNKDLQAQIETLKARLAKYEPVSA